MRRDVCICAAMTDRDSPERQKLYAAFTLGASCVAFLRLQVHEQLRLDHFFL